MRHLGFVLLLVVSLLPISFGQEVVTNRADANSPTAVLVDEFGRKSDCENSAITDNFFIQLNNNESAQGYVIFYRGLDMLPYEWGRKPRSIAQMLQSIRFRRYDQSRLTFIDGGFRRAQSTELFLVPEGAMPPKPSETVPTPKMPVGTFQWSEKHICCNGVELRVDSVIVEEKEEELRQIEEESKLAAEEGREPTEETEPEVVEELTTDESHDLHEMVEERPHDWFDRLFVDQLTERKGASGVIVVYADDEIYDLRKLQDFIGQTIQAVATEKKVSPKLFTIRFGGYREFTQVEFWIVPKGGKKPGLRPHTRPVD